MFRHILLTVCGYGLMVPLAFGADWSKGVRKVLAKGGHRLASAPRANQLRALQLGVREPVSKDQYNLIDYSLDENKDLDLPNTLDAKASDIPLTANSLDVIFAHQVAEQFEPQAYLIEADRLLRPGGAFFLTFEVHKPSSTLLQMRAMLNADDIKDDLMSTEEILIRFEKSTYLAHLWGWDMLEIKPGELKFPYAPIAYGIAFVKPVSAEQANMQMQNPRWRLPKMMTEFYQRNSNCSRFVTSGFKRH